MKKFILAALAFSASSMAFAESGELGVMKCVQKDARPGAPSYYIATAQDPSNPAGRVYLLRKQGKLNQTLAQLAIPMSSVKITARTLNINFDEQRRGGYAKFKVDAKGAARIDIAVSAFLNVKPGNISAQELNTFGVVTDYKCTRVR